MNNNSMIVLLALIILVIAGFFVYNEMNETIPVSERMDDASQSLGEGNLGNAIDDMQNTTPAQRMQETMEDAGDAIREGANDMMDALPDITTTTPTDITPTNAPPTMP